MSNQNGSRIKRYTRPLIAALVLVGMSAIAYGVFWIAVEWLESGPTPDEIAVVGLLLILVAFALFATTVVENPRGKTVLEHIINE